MSLDHLWAGWRSEYVTSVTAAAPADAGGGDAASPGGRSRPLRVLPDRGQRPAVGRQRRALAWGAATFVVLNAYPYASGHLMVVPTRHVGSLADLTEDEGAELWSALRRGVAALEAALGPEGINLGANLGRAAGAGIPRHLHLHAVPRWVGDTNFMTAVAGARVLPETLAVTWERLHRAWPE